MEEDHLDSGLKCVLLLPEEGWGFFSEVHQDFSSHPPHSSLDVGDLEDAGQQFHEFLEGLPEEFGLDFQHLGEDLEALFLVAALDELEDSLVDSQDQGLELSVVLGIEDLEVGLEAS